MAATDYQVFSAGYFVSGAPPRLFYKIGGAAVGNVTMVPISPTGVVGTPVVMTNFGGGGAAAPVFYADVVDAYALGQWTFLCYDDGAPAATVVYGSFQWGGLANFLFANYVALQPGGTVYENVATTKTEVTVGGALYDMLFHQLSNPAVHNTVAEWTKSAYDQLSGAPGADTIRGLLSGVNFLLSCSWTTDPVTGVATLTDGTTTLHVTVSNADGSPINGAQILNRTLPV